MNVPTKASIPIPIPAQNLPRDPIDTTAVLKRCGGDPNFAAAVIERFRTQAGAEIAKLDKALAEKDTNGLSRAAHNLKSMSAYMAADSAVELAKQIEALGHANRLSDVPPLLALLRSEIERAVAWIAQNQNSPVAQCA
jgi:HPt (histidine-containing phosphotransfer) domain-containing protein